MHPGGVLQDATVTIKKDFGTTGTTLYNASTNTLDWGEPLLAPFGAILLLLALERAGYGSTAPRHGPLLCWLVKRSSFLISMLEKH